MTEAPKQAAPSTPLPMSAADKYAHYVKMALDHVAQQDGGGDLNAVLGALASVQAGFIAMIPDRNVRRAAIKSCHDALEKQVAAMAGEKVIGPKVQTIIMPGGGRPN